MHKPILFISTMAGDPFGGSEELWTQTATLLAKQGLSVAASVHGWPRLDRRISELSRVGVDLRPRPAKPSLVVRARRYTLGKAQIVFDIERSFGDFSPSLVVISDGGAFPSIDLTEMCASRRWPFATLVHSNFECWWPPDELAARYRKVLTLARRCFFVSEANKTLAERQLGCSLDNAEVVRNPLAVDYESSISWPTNTSGGELRMACVGRLYPTQKGQDILFDILAAPNWAARNWRLTLYGDGPNRDLLERLVKRLKLDDRVSFAGHVLIEKIWGDNHVLVMPSRYEGGPMTTIEAMFCGRPVVATNVGSNREFIEDGVTGFLARSAAFECFGNALERMWTQRDKLQEIGRRAAISIRELVPNNAVGTFAEKLKDMALAK